MWFQHRPRVLALCALADKRDRIPSLFQPFITYCVIEQDAHETPNLGPSCVGQRRAICSGHLSQPALNNHSPDISDIDIGRRTIKILTFVRQTEGRMAPPYGCGISNQSMKIQTRPISTCLTIPWSGCSVFVTVWLIERNRALPYGRSISGINSLSEFPGGEN